MICVQLVSSSWASRILIGSGDWSHPSVRRLSDFGLRSDVIELKTIKILSLYRYFINSEPAPDFRVGSHGSVTVTKDGNRRKDRNTITEPPKE